MSDIQAERLAWTLKHLGQGWTLMRNRMGDVSLREAGGDYSFLEALDLAELLDRGYVELDSMGEWRTATYRLTAAGRAAVPEPPTS